MPNLLLDSSESLSLLYGESFYISPLDFPLVEQAKEPVIEPVVPAVKETKAEKPVPPKTKLEPVVETPAQKPGITWKPKSGSLVLFVLQVTEFKNPELTDLLKKIVDSLGIHTDLVGFGQIDGPVQLEEFDRMPNPFAVVFDAEIWGGAENPVKFGKGEVFFSHRLSTLQNNDNLKRTLWVYLKKLKDRIQST